MIRHFFRRSFILLLLFGMFIFLLPCGVFAQTEVAVDIKPGSCPNPINIKSQGVLTVAILGTEDFDVTTIDPASIRLLFDGTELAAPIRSKVEDVAAPFVGDLLSCEDCYISGPDGCPDLTVKFRTQDIIAALSTDIEEGVITDGQCIVLEITGSADEGRTVFAGADVVRILIKGKTPNRYRNGNRNTHRNFPTE